ncbi:hypothetical protein M2138_001176 [Dysgonomonadaceae bacterium PH5-43]|nr:hypothetical protein [Dysgonomonadaceae bacterium PH5-43]
MKKKIVRILLIIIAALLAVILLVYALLWVPPVQQKIKDIALKEVMKITGNQISIGNLYLRPFNKLKLDNIYVEDLSGDTLLYADKLSAGFDLFKMLDNHLLIKSVELENFVANINKDSVNGDFNFQFIIDAFSSEDNDTTSTSSMSVRIDDIKIKGGNINYDILSEPLLSDVFDYNHISINDLETDVNLKSIDIESLDVALNKFSLKERSGIVVNNIALKANSDNERININDLQIDILNSTLNVPEAWVDYSGYELKDIVAKGKYFVRSDNNSINLSDFKMFYADIAAFKEELTFSINTEGQLPEVTVNNLKANYGEGMRLKLAAYIKDFNKWENTPLELNIDYLDIYENGLEHIADFAMSGELPINVNSVNVSGNLSGRLPDININLSAKTDVGDALLNANGGYEFDSGDAQFNISLLANDFDINTILNDTVYGWAGLQAEAIGSISGSGVINARASANINRFDYNGYSYNNVNANGSYVGDSIMFIIDSKDINLPLYAEGKANIGKYNPSANIYLRADSINLDTLNIIPNVNNIIFATAIKADVKGFDLEKMYVDLTIDSLFFRNEIGEFYEPSLNLIYNAADSSSKELSINSRHITADAKGQFSYNGFIESMKETLPGVFGYPQANIKKKDEVAETFNFRIGINEINSVTDLLDLPQAIPDSIFFMGRYRNNGTDMNLSLSAYTMFTESDTIIASIILKNIEDRLGANIHIDNKSSNYDFDGGVDAEIEFLPVTSNNGMPNMNIFLNPSLLVLNETFFDLNPSRIEIRDSTYTVYDLSLSQSENPNEYIKLDGVVSASKADSLTVDVSHFQFGTVFGAMKADIPLSGEANGKITARNILSAPFILTRNLSINNIIFSGNEIGDINIKSGWNSERNGIALRATLDHPEREQSVISGFANPETDSLRLNATIKDIQMKWIEPFTEGLFYGLEGNIGANISIKGKIKTPEVSGTAYFDKSRLGINMLNTLYTITDTLYISSDRVEVKQFTLKDENNNKLVVDGKVTHNNFAKINPDISISFNNFQVMNNENKTDSLFYGNLRLNGQLKFTKQHEDYLLSGNMTHTPNSKLMINIPSSAKTADRYNFVTYVDAEGIPIAEDEIDKLAALNVNFPFRVNVNLTLNSGLHAGVVYNMATGDAAEVSGNGTIGFTYELGSPNMNLSGDFVLESGKATLSLLNITKKTLTVEEGSKLIFKGNPLNTSFDVTALYSLRADLATLDQSFSDLMSRTRIPVTVAITATGNMNNPELKYDLRIPNQPEEIQRKVSGLLYTDDIKIKQIAYLLAVGSFMPPDLNGAGNSNNLLTTVGSSALSSALNSALSGILNDNWSIGTDLKAGEDGFNDMDVDVNISTQLFDDRLTINGTIGYTNDEASTNNNLTGDFDVEYKLVPSGNIVLKAYNKTNNKYFETAPYTQGVGVVYKRNAKTFKRLFDKLIWRKEKEEK